MQTTNDYIQQGKALLGSLQNKIMEHEKKFNIADIQSFLFEVKSNRFFLQDKIKDLVERYVKLSSEIGHTIKLDSEDSLETQKLYDINELRKASEKRFGKICNQYNQWKTSYYKHRKKIERESEDLYAKTLKSKQPFIVQKEKENARFKLTITPYQRRRIQHMYNTDHDKNEDQCNKHISFKSVSDRCCVLFVYCLYLPMSTLVICKDSDAMDRIKDEQTYFDSAAIGKNVNELFDVIHLNELEDDIVRLKSYKRVILITNSTMIELRTMIKMNQNGILKSLASNIWCLS